MFFPGGKKEGRMSRTTQTLNFYALTMDGYTVFKEAGSFWKPFKA